MTEISLSRANSHCLLAPSHARVFWDHSEQSALLLDSNPRLRISDESVHVTIETFIASCTASCDAIQGRTLSAAEKHQQMLNSAMHVLSQAGSVAHPTRPPLSSLGLNKIYVRLKSLALTSEYLLVRACDARNIGQSSRCNCHLCSSNKVAVSTK